MFNHDELQKLTKALDEIEEYNRFKSQQITAVEKERFELLKNSFKENYDYVNTCAAFLMSDF
jgi:hypothetical protein